MFKGTGVQGVYTVNVYRFNFYNQLIYEKTEERSGSYPNIIKRIYNEKIYTYAHVGNKNPELITSRYYQLSSGGLPTSNYYETKECFSYNSMGDIIAYWDSQAEGNANDTEHKTTFTYDNNNYGIPLTITYKKDNNTTIEEINNLTANLKSIDSAQVKVNGALQKSTDFTYDIYGNPTVAKEYYDAANYLQTNYVYNNGAYLASKTINGVSENYTYDTVGNMRTYRDGNGNTYSYIYDGFGRVTKITNPDNTAKTYTYNDYTNRIFVTNERIYNTVYQYNPLGNLVSVKTPLGVSGDYSQKQLQYDPYLNISKETDALGNYTEYTYDYLNRPLSVTSKSSSGTVLAQENYSYHQNYNNEKYDRVTKIISGDVSSPNITSETQTDKHGFKTRQIRYIGNTPYIDYYSYDYLGNVVHEALYPDALTYAYATDYSGQVTAQSFKDGTAIYISYDMLGRKTSQRDQLGNLSQYNYDALSRLANEWVPFESSYSAQKSYYYDNNGNLTYEHTSNHAPGQSNTYSQISYQYDNRNRLIRANDNLGSGDDIIYAYDNVGNRTMVKTSNGAQTTYYSYDADNQLTTMQDPLNQTESYLYNQAGSLSRKIDRNGAHTYYYYDGLNRLSQLITNGITKTYTYSKTGKLVNQNENGATISYNYDDLGRLTSSSQPGGITENYTYNGKDQRTTFSLAHNGTTQINQNYVYDSMDRLYQVQQNGSVIASYSYNARGETLSQTMDNGVTTSYAYNKAGLVTNLNNQNGGTNLSAYSYTYYLDGNQKSKTEIVNNITKTTNYTYDGKGRLSQEQELGGQTRSYLYDNAGNRSQMQVTGTEPHTKYYTYDANKRLIKENIARSDSTETIHYNYDSNGNQISKIKETDHPATAEAQQSLGIFSLGSYNATGNYLAELNSYDALNRLTASYGNGYAATYTYRPDDLRHSKTVNGVTTFHAWNGQNMVLETNDSGGVVNRFFRGNQLIALENSGGRNYYLHNAHGDVVQLTNTGGAVTANYGYDAFGVQPTANTADNNPFRYAGEYADTETGYIYLRARYYDAGTGRFLSEDPIRDGVHWYIYCSNNPMKFLDPFGLAQILLNDYVANTTFGNAPIFNLSYNNNNKTSTIAATVNSEAFSFSYKAGQAGVSLTNGKMYVEDYLLPMGQGNYYFDVYSTKTNKDNLQAILQAATLLHGDNLTERVILGVALASDYTGGGKGKVVKAGAKTLKGTGSKATADVRKFSEYIFKDGAAPGKDVVYKNLGYTAKDSQMLTNLYQEQAAAKYASGNYTLGKLDSFGQRINIEIELNGIGSAAGKTSYLQSGWMIKPDGSINLNTPFSGFTR